MKIGSGPQIEGQGNISAGRDVVIKGASYALPPSRSDFNHLDQIYCSQVNSDQIVIRQGKELKFSAEGLFTSLMRVGVSYSNALEATERVIDLLADLRTESNDPNWKPATVNIRAAVLQVLNALGEDKKCCREHVSLWFAAYIRRYGNPSNDCMKVIDHNEFVDLTYEYISERVLPHLLSRIVGMDRTENPLERFSESVFKRQTRDQMAKAVMEYTKELNVYAIRYKTLIYLLQDLVLEPPHPWIVNSATLKRITVYNIDRAKAHYDDISRGGREYGFEFSSKECMQHICAAVLSKYGAFLGVDHKYGVFELRRFLLLKSENPDLWESCRLADLYPDMQKVGVDKAMFIRILDVARHLWNLTPREDTNQKLFKCATQIMKMCAPLLSEYRGNQTDGYPIV